MLHPTGESLFVYVSESVSICCNVIEVYRGLTCSNVPIRVTRFLCVTVVDIDIVISVVLNPIISKDTHQEERRGYQKPMGFNQTSGVKYDRLIDVTLT